MDKGYWQSAELTNDLFWYGVMAGLAAAILGLFPDSSWTLGIISFVLNAINFLLILIASILAYAYRKQTEPELYSHYQYLIRTLWLMVIFSIISMLIMLNSQLANITTAMNSLSNSASLNSMDSTTSATESIINTLFNLLTSMWLFMRIYKARKLLHYQHAIPNFNTWLF